MDVKLTDIMNAGAVRPGERPAYGTLLNQDGLYAPNHQHFFCFRLEPMIDGLYNSVVETNTVLEEKETPFGNAFNLESQVTRHEDEAQRDMNPFSSCRRKLLNPS